jgi:hypothetical protein
MLLHMMGELLIKAQHSEALSDFAKRLADLVQSAPWEEGGSENFPDGYYFRQRFGLLEIVAQIADDSEHPDADFLLWIRGSEDSGGLMDTLAQMLV